MEGVMDVNTFKLLELIMLFGVILAFGFWQLHSVNKEIRARKACKKQAANGASIATTDKP